MNGNSTELIEIETFCNDLLIRVDRAAQLLGLAEPEDFAAALPSLYGLYTYAARELIALPEAELSAVKDRFRENAEDLEDACVLEDGGAEELVKSYTLCLEAITEAAKRAKDEETEGGPAAAAVDAALFQLDCTDEGVRQSLRRQLADFAVTYRMGSAPQSHS